MKKLILSSLLIGAAFSIKAQITISNTSFPKLGDRIIMHNDTLLNSAITPGSAGANQTWNFTTIQSGAQDTSTAVALSATPLSVNFPGATIAINQGGGSVAFMKAGTADLEVLGFSGDFMGTGTPLSIHFNPTQIVAKAGMTFGSTDTNTSGFRITLPGSAIGQVLLDSIRMTLTQTVYNNFDAWGTVTTPTGTYNCLRNNSTNFSIQTIDVKPIFPPGWQLGAQIDTTTSQSYLYLDNASALEVAGIDVDTSGLVVGAHYRELGSVLGVTTTTENSIKMNVFPSPANSASVILTSGLNAGSYHGEVYTVNGQLVNQLTLVASNGLVAMNLHDMNLASGTYVASIRNAAGEVVVSRKFQFVK